MCLINSDSVRCVCSYITKFRVIAEFKHVWIYCCVAVKSSSVRNGTDGLHDDVDNSVMSGYEQSFIELTPIEDVGHRLNYLLLSVVETERVMVIGIPDGEVEIGG